MARFVNNALTALFPNLTRHLTNQGDVVEVRFLRLPSQRAESPAPEWGPGNMKLEELLHGV